MGAWFSALPGKLVAGTVVAFALTAALTILLLWHAVRRALDVPRITRPPAMYGTLTVAWVGLAAMTVAVVLAGALLRDHQRLAGPTDLAVVRCQPNGAGRLRMEVLPLGSRQAAAPEVYDLDGQSCAASVVEIEVRPGVRVLGIPGLARLDAVGPFTRPRTNPAWLTPGSPQAELTSFVVRQSRVVHVVIPPDPARRFVLTATPGQDASLREAQKS